MITMLRTILFLAYFSFTMQKQQQSVSSTPKPKVPLAPLAPLVPLGPKAPLVPIPREKQLVIVPKENDIRRQMWDTGNSAAAATEKRRLAELANAPKPSFEKEDEDQILTYIRFPIFLTLLIFAFWVRSPIYKSIRSHLLKYNKNLEVRRNISHEMYAIGVKEEVRHNLKLQHTQHPLVRSRTNLSKGDLSV
jgi:hypothetical protein